MTDLTLAEEMEELVSAEDFLDYFGVEHDPKIVNVNRLHILQRFHDYIESTADLPEQENDNVLYERYKEHLSRAYQDFVESDAATEKVFKVFHSQDPQTTFVPVDQILE